MTKAFSGEFMKKVTVISALLSSLLAFSCATAGKTTAVTMPEAVIDLGSMSRDQYIILGQVSGESSVTAKASDIARDLKNKVDNFREVNSYTIKGDDGNYGFIGEARQNLTVLERAQALALYRMIELARYNGADAVMFVNTTVSTDTKTGFEATTDINVKVTGIAVKIKADAGFVIEPLPEPEPEPEAEPAAEETAAESAEEAKPEVSSESAE